MMIRSFSRLNYLFILSSILVVYGLFYIKDRVINVNYQLNEIKRQITLEKDKIVIMKTELTYLTSNQKLMILAGKNSNLEIIKTSQIIEDPLKSQNNLAPTNNKIEIALKSKIKAKWRYKKLADKYLQTVSHGK